MLGAVTVSPGTVTQPDKKGSMVVAPISHPTPTPDSEYASTTVSHFLLFVLSGCGAPLDSGDSGASESPQVFIVSPKTGSAFAAGEVIELLAIVSDDRDKAEEMLVEIRSVSRVLITAGYPDELGQLSLAAVLPGGQQTITFEVEDSEGHATSESVTVTVEAFDFQPPVVDVVPAAAVSGDALKALILTDAVPGAGTLVDYAYLWTRDGAPTDWAEATVPAGEVHEGELWEVSVVGRSETEESSPATASQTIGNAPPLLGEALVESDGVNATCNHGPITDPEGDVCTIRYRWNLDGALIVATTESIVVPDGPRGAALGCTLSVGDGTNGVAVDALPWILPNHAPTFGTVTVSPATLTAESTSTCTLSETVTDVDGDSATLSFGWSVDGSVTGGSASTLVADLVRGQAVACTATAIDGFGGTTSVNSASVSVSNSPPTTPRISISPAAPTAGDLLTCRVTSSSTDLDGDPVSCTTRWDIGLPAGAGTSFDTQGLRDGTDVMCVVTCSDGFESATAATATVTLTSGL